MEKRLRAGLFDLDGVILDTETQYSRFWGMQGRLAHPELPEFSKMIKGHTLEEIVETYFPGKEQAEKVIREIFDFESKMTFDFVPGVMDFACRLKKEGVRLAIVTSSNNEKMQNVFRIHPELTDVFDVMITADKISRSKPDPECYLLAAEELGVSPGNCSVFEDSFAGLEAGRRAGMFVVGVATTNPAEVIKDKADLVIPDFMEITSDQLRR